MNTKKKGNKYEIKICKALTRWVNEGKEKPLLFWKIGSSGAQATLTKDVKSKLVGDLVAIDERGTWLTDIVVVEMKDDKRANVLDFIYTANRKHWMLEIWNDLVIKADKAERRPWLIFHRHNTRLDYIVVGREFDEIMNLSTMDKLEFEDGVIYELNEFLSLLSPEKMKKEFA